MNQSQIEYVSKRGHWRVNLL